MADDQDGHGDDRPDEDPQDPAVAEVSVTAPGVSITRRVDEATMASIISLLFGHSPATRAHLSAGEDQRRESLPWMDPEERSTQLSDDVTLGEFLVETEANTFPQKICAAGYYLTNNQGAESFSRDDIRDALVSAREDLPGNFSRDWTSAMSSNLIAVRPGNAGQFYVPRTGRTAVESQFQELGKRRPARRGTKNDSSTRKENGE